MTPDQLISASERLRDEFAVTASEIDASGEYPEQNLVSLHESGFSTLPVPEAFGGISTGRYEELPLMTRILTNLAAGESSTAQIWMVSTSLASSMLGPWSPLSPAAQEKLAAEVLDGARFCSAAAERVKPRFSYKTRAVPVEGGMSISGIKRFATGVNGATYAYMPVLHSDYDSIESGGLHMALLRLDSPGVTILDDWDNMGQRATGSCSVELKDVFVPDGFHWAPPASVPAHQDVSGPANQVQFASILLGIGQGALRAVTPMITGLKPDPDNPFDVAAITQWQMGQLYVSLRGAEALIAESSEAVRAFEGRDAAERAAVSATMMCAKVAAAEASLDICERVHQFGGGRSTTQASGLDMYWRNARTLSTHDPQDVKKRHLGTWALDGTHPPVNALS